MDAGTQGAGGAATAGLEELMDEYLKSQGFYRKKIAKDGSCLFRAVAEQVLHCQSRHTEVRATCVGYLRRNRDKYESFIEGNFDEYLKRLEDPQNWVGEVEISALAVIYKHDFIIFQEPGKPPVNITENSFTDKVRLCFLNGNHYDSVYPQEFISNAAVCQCKCVYQNKKKRIARLCRVVLVFPSQYFTIVLRCGARMLTTCTTVLSQIARSLVFMGTNVGFFELLSSLLQTSGTSQASVLSPRVHVSLNPLVFRNVEYDVWLRSKRAQQKRDFCIAAGMQYVVGEKCKVRLDKSGQTYSAYVQEVSPNNGPVTVYIEELGQKHSVSLWNLRPPTDNPETWSTVAERGRRHTVANGTANSNRSGTEWESRGKKPSKIQSPSTQNIPRMTQNRMQKQIPWSLQAFTEEQTSTKSSHSTARRNDTGAANTPPQETRSGLLPEERITKEEQKPQSLQKMLCKDEKNFPTLSSANQAAAQTSESGRKGSGQSIESGRKVGGQPGDKRGSKKKGDLQERPWDGERKTHSPKTGTKVEKNKSLVTSRLESPVQMPTDQTSPPPSEQPSGSSAPASTLVQPSSACGPVPKQPSKTLGPSTSASVQPTIVPAAATSVSCLVTQAGQPPASVSTQPTQGHGPPHSDPAQPTETPRTFISDSAQPTETPGTSSSPSAQPTQDLHPPTSVFTLPKQTPGLPTSSSTLPTQAHGPSPYVPQPSQVPHHSSVPPASTPLHSSFQQCVVPTLPPQTGPSVLTSYSSPSLPVDTPPYEAASVMPQLRISPLPDHQNHSHASTCPPHGSVGQPSMPVQQFPLPYQDPLYPGFPLNDKEEMAFIPPFSLMRSGEDLPRGMEVQRLQLNLCYAYLNPMWSPYSYIYPLQQAYYSACAMQPKLPSAAPYMPPWLPPDAHTPQSILHVNSIPSSSMTVPENYSQVVLGAAGGRALGQFEHPGGAVSLGSESRPAVGYNLQSPMQLPSHAGNMLWPRPGAFAGTISSTAPPPLMPFPQQFVPSAPYPPALPGYPTPKLPAAADYTNTTELGKTMVRASGNGSARSAPVPFPEAELSAEDRVSAAASPAQVFVPAERVASPCERQTTASSTEVVAETVLNRAEVSFAPHRGHVSLGEQTRSDGDLQGSGSVVGGTESIVPLAHRGPPNDGASQPYSTPREHYGEEGSAKETAYGATKPYYNSSYRPRRSFEDGRAWRSSRGASRTRRDYNYRERRSADTYTGTFDKSHRGRGYSQYRGGREVDHLGDGQRNVPYVKP
ncbi:OTU domain-containing protein 4 [Arapaima gigas]